MDQDAASKGKVDVAKEGFEKPSIEPDQDKDATELKVSAGGLFASGNARLVAVTSSGGFRARRDANQLTLAAAGNYSESAAAADDDLAPTVANVQGRLRYDRFFGAGFAGFLASSARRDRFQGLDLRLNVDPGLAYYFLDREKHRFWTEVGYDLQFDVRRSENLASARAEGAELERTDVRHSARLFLGYENNLNEVVTLVTGAEYLQGLPETEYWRLNWDIGLTSRVADNLSVATSFWLRYDNQPLPGVEELDTITAVSLVYQLL
jgi:putative salt-induced outer membrane protein